MLLFLGGMFVLAPLFYALEVGVLVTFVPPIAIVVAHKYAKG